MIYNRIIKWDTDYWQVIEQDTRWVLIKHGVTIYHPKLPIAETYDQFTDRLLKTTSTDTT